MSEFFLCEIENIEKSGVEIKVTGTRFKKDDDADCIRTVRTVCFDFTEHDKVFEDKIAKLENQIDRLNEEKSFLRTRCMPYVEKDFDKRLYGKLSIVSCNEEFVDIQKYADGDDLYSIEVRNLISEGGVKRLIGQYRNLSSRLDKMSDENKELKQITKGYEDKIAELKKDYKTASELLGKYQQENEALKKRIQELDTIDSIRIDEKRELKQRISELEIKNKQLKHGIDKMAEIKSKWIDRAVEWQQKCEKLESKETKKPTKINLNDKIKVKLTPLGAEIYYHQYDEVNKQIKENGGTELESIMPQIDKDGYTEFQLHHFISIYGEYIGMCKPNVISSLDIIITE